MSIDVLQEKIRVLKNPTMVGLDPTPEVVPGYLLEEARRELGVTPAAAAAAYSRFCRELLEGLRDVVPAVKVQSAETASRRAQPGGTPRRCKKNA